MSKIKLLALLTLIFTVSCNQKPSPKPNGYFRIDLPEKSYQVLKNDYPFTFEYPKYAKIFDYNVDSSWINIIYPANNAIVYITYKKVNNNLARYLEETRKFVYKHTLKADAISETTYLNPEKDVYGVLYDIKGNAASSINFFVTDSTQNFLRGALYFDVEPNKDSLAPVINFIRKDIVHLMETFGWK